MTLPGPGVVDEADFVSDMECFGADEVLDNPNRQSDSGDNKRSMSTEAPEKGLQVVERLREEGNTKFRATDFLGAEQCYEEAARLLDQSRVELPNVSIDSENDHHPACRAPVLLNLALCYLKRQPCEAYRAVECCDAVLAMEPAHPKATYRRAKALVELGELAEAQRELVRACKLLPKDASARRELEHLRQCLPKLADRRGQACQDVGIFDELWSERKRCPENGSAQAARRLGFLLGSCRLVQELETSGHASVEAMDALSRLAEQAVWMGIDYRTLGLGWNHPTTRSEYRCGQHPSTTHRASRRRAAESRRQLFKAVEEVTSGSREVEAVIVEGFLREVGLSDGARAACGAKATYAAVVAALRAELMLPLRALNEGEEFMHKTYRGTPVPAEAIASCLEALMLAVLSRPDGFSSWRYTNPIGVEQLRGLSSAQLDCWKQPLSIEHDEEVRTHEDSENELGFFWAGKIGGPSHGFDFEAQCCLPLLANARSKVILTSVPSWPSHPAGRAHFKLLWTAPGAVNTSDVAETDAPEQANGSAKSEPRLWLEAVNCDFAAEEEEAVDKRSCIWFTLQHAMSKSNAMRTPLSVGPQLLQALRAIVEDQEMSGSVSAVEERLLLRPSNGVLEASDYLSSKHDWVQQSEEVTELIKRALYTPGS